MFGRKGVVHHRREFLLDSNLKNRRRSKKNRNRFLGIFSRMLGFKGLLRHLKFSLFFILMLVGMGGFIGFAMLSPYFDLQEIKVIRNHMQLDPAKIQETLQDYYGQNLLFVSKDQMKADLKQVFPEFRSISVGEQWPNALELKIQLSPPFFTLYDEASANFYTLSEDGVVLGANLNEQLTVIKLIDQSKPIQLRDRFVNTKTVRRMALAKTLTEQNISVIVQEILFLKSARELHLVTSQGIEIWFDLTVDIEPQLRKLELALNKEPILEKAVSHIDLRVSTRLFWE